MAPLERLKILLQVRLRDLPARQGTGPAQTGFRSRPKAHLLRGPRSLPGHDHRCKPPRQASHQSTQVSGRCVPHTIALELGARSRRVPGPHITTRGVDLTPPDTRVWCIWLDTREYGG